jgi:hypothetical protein
VALIFLFRTADSSVVGHRPGVRRCHNYLERKRLLDSGEAVLQMSVGLDVLLRAISQHALSGQIERMGEQSELDNPLLYLTRGREQRPGGAHPDE